MAPSVHATSSPHAPLNPASSSSCPRVALRFVRFGSKFTVVPPASQRKVCPQKLTFSTGSPHGEFCAKNGREQLQQDALVLGASKKIAGLRAAIAGCPYTRSNRFYAAP